MIRKLLFILCVLLPATALADRQVAAGSTSKCFAVKVNDTAGSGNAGKTGLAYNTATLACGYYREGAGTGGTAITMQASTLGTYTSGAWKQIDATKQPGVYEFCVPDAALATGANWVEFTCNGVSSMTQMDLHVTLLSPNTYGYDGKIASESGTSIGLATGAIDSTDQFAYSAELAVFDSAGLLEAVSCITAAVAATEVVTTAEDITGPIAVNDNYLVRANNACRNLRPTTAGRTLDVATTGEAGADFSNINGTLDASEIGADAITAAKIAADAIGASEIAADAIGASELAADSIASSELAASALAEINAEVVDALATDTYTELTSCPTATASITTMLRYLLMLARNKLGQTSSTFTLYRDDGSTSLCTSTTSDSGSLFTRGELN